QRWGATDIPAKAIKFWRKLWKVVHSSTRFSWNYEFRRCPRLFELMLVDTKRADLRIESRCRQAELSGSAAEDPPHTVLNEPRMRSIVHVSARLLWAVRGSN